MPPAFRGRLAALAGRFRPDGHTLFLIAVSVLGAALVLARGLTHGPALHWDSINYLAVARNLLAGEGFLNYDGTPYTLWPPLYPLLLALLTVGGPGLLDPLAVAGPLNAALLGVTIFVAGRYLHRRLESRFLALWAPLVLALALPLGELARWALSETLFVLLLTLALIAAADHLAEGRRSSLALAALCGALALLTRYQGVGVVAAVALAPLFRRGDRPGTRVKRSALVFLAGLAPTALWLLRNARLTGGVTGHPPPDADALSWTLGLLLDGLARWIRFDGDFGTLAAAALGGLPLAFLIAFLVARSESRPSGAAAKGPGCRLGWQPVAVFGGYCLANAVSLAAAAGAVSIGAGSGLRYADAAFLPAVVAAVFALDRLLRRERQRKLLGDLPSRPIPGAGGRVPAPSLLTLLLTAGLTVWAVGQTVRTARAIGRANSPTLVLETAYNAAPWTEIEALSHLREHPEAELVFTNLPPLPRIVIHHTTNGRAKSRSLPIRAGEGGRDAEPGRGAGAAGAPEPTPDERLRAFFDRAPEGALVLWLSRWSSGSLYDYGRPALRLQPALQPLAEFADGAVFRVDRRLARAAAPRPDPYRAAYDTARPAGDGGRSEAEADAGPDAATGFTVLLRPAGSSGLPGFDGAALLYLRAPCDEDAARARFFLHLYPEETADLPAARRESGFANLDFRFAEHGVRLDGESSSPKCLAIVPLPGYPLRRIRTGQWTAGAGESWAAEIVPGESR